MRNLCGSRGPSWRTANGHRLPIAAMTDGHLINTLRMLERLAEQAAEEIPFPDFQGEMAQRDGEEAWYDAQVTARTPDHPAYDHLVLEANRRELSW